ncbi:hypothetical protein B0H14DRAFT_2595762 [Mycena olivaceomarginata]|nr:hypothetical protein B0H14DRAFT_2595762 [Mycena olivaceomarginata]
MSWCLARCVNAPQMRDSTRRDGLSRVIVGTSTLGRPNPEGPPTAFIARGDYSNGTNGFKTMIVIPTSNDRMHAMGVFEVGPQLDKTAFHDLVEELAKHILELPAAKKNILKKTLWFQNEQIREDLNARDDRERGRDMPCPFYSEGERTSDLPVPSLLECTCCCTDIVAKINKDEA